MKIKLPISLSLPTGLAFFALSGVTTQATAQTSILIQAEDFTAMSGVETEVAQDVDGDLNVSNTHAGDYMDYEIDIPAAGTYLLEYREASKYDGQLSFLLGETVLDTLPYTASGNWQDWRTITSESAIELAAGIQTFRVNIDDGRSNINWFSLTEYIPPVDTDEDGVPDEDDAFPNDPTETVDTDLDGTGNNADLDDDEDGVVDLEDAFPLDATETVDTDNDGIGDNEDTDDDNDGILDGDGIVIQIQAEDFTAMFGVETETAQDVDGDLNVSLTHAGDYMDYEVNIPEAGKYRLDYREASKYDGQLSFLLGETVLDTIAYAASGNWQDWRTLTSDAILELTAGIQTFRINIDEGRSNLNWFSLTLVVDTDSDGVYDAIDAFPSDETESVDTDDDGVGNNADTDDDNDNVADDDDAFPLDETEYADADSDGIGDNEDTDDDNDGILDVDEVVLRIQAEDFTEMSGVGTETAQDVDGDLNVSLTHAGDYMDYEIDVPVAGQYRLDYREASKYDGQMSFLSGETILDTLTYTASGNWQTWRTISSEASIQLEAGVQTFRINIDEGRSNLNWFELALLDDQPDVDTDNDGVFDSEDAFPTDPLETSDNDSDGTGDNADLDDDNDGVLDLEDAFPLDATETVDTDEDGIGDNADDDDDGDSIMDVDEVTAEFINISTRSYVIDGDKVMIAGFVVEGTEAITVLVQGVGTELDDSPFFVDDNMTDTVVGIYDSDGALIAENDDWDTDADEALLIVDASDAMGSFPLMPDSKSSAIITTLEPGVYTAILSGKDATGGVALVEVYKIDLSD